MSGGVFYDTTVCKEDICRKPALSGLQENDPDGLERMDHKSAVRPQYRKRQLHMPGLQEKVCLPGPFHKAEPLHKEGESRLNENGSIRRPDAPCHGCKDRYEDCHSTCDRYAEYCVLNADYAQKIQKEKAKEADFYNARQMKYKKHVARA